MNARKRLCQRESQFRTFATRAARRGQHSSAAARPQIGLLNVSQSDSLPLLKPRANQVWRCSEVP